MTKEELIDTISKNTNSVTGAFNIGFAADQYATAQTAELQKEVELLKFENRELRSRIEWCEINWNPANQ